MLGFKCIERGGVAQRQADVIQSFEQAVATKGIDGKFCREALIVAYRLVFKRNGELVARRLRALHQRGDLLLWQHDQQNAVLARV